MIPTAFDYVRPSTVGEAVTVLSGAGEDAKVLAGGQSLLPILRLRMADPGLLVDLGHLDELRGVRQDDGAIVIGAMTTHHDVMHDPLLLRHAPLIAQATATVADRQVRHRGTFGGAISHADPAGDLPAAALALEATMVVQGPGGVRDVAAQDFFVDYMTTALLPDEILTAVRIPALGDGWASHYEKFTITAQAWAVVGAAVAVHCHQGMITHARVALTNMGPVPVRAVATEQALAGAVADPAAIATAAQSAADETNPPTDLAGSAEYRRELARVLTRRAAIAAIGSA